MQNIIRRFLHPGHALAGLMRKYWYYFPNDERYLKLIYFLEMGHRLDLDNPKLFTEKLQWLKLYDRNPEYIQMVDKITAKEYVADIIGAHYIIPTLGVWQHFDEIDFNKLPSRFVLKTNHGSGSNGIIVCKDIETFDYEYARMKLECELCSNTYNKYREWPYKCIEPKIFAEAFLEEGGSDGSLTDYKFYCFNGKVHYCQVIKNRLSNETIDFFDMDWKHQEFIGLNPNAVHSEVIIKKPANFQTMMDFAGILSKHLSFARIDFYYTNNQVYFGEITFYPASGLGKFTPSRYDKILGEMIELPKNKMF